MFLKVFNTIFNIISFLLVYLGLVWSNTVLNWMGYNNTIPVIASIFLAFKLVQYINKVENVGRTRKNQGQMGRT